MGVAVARRLKKQRRSIKKRLKHGETANARHTSPSGRTGSVYSKKTKS